MSGGSYGYLYQKVQNLADALLDASRPEVRQDIEGLKGTDYAIAVRAVHARHHVGRVLKAIAKLLKDIEWADSLDTKWTHVLVNRCLSLKAPVDLDEATGAPRIPIEVDPSLPPGMMKRRDVLYPYTLRVGSASPSPSAVAWLAERKGAYMVLWSAHAWESSGKLVLAAADGCVFEFGRNRHDVTYDVVLTGFPTVFRVKVVVSKEAAQ
jgi:hypothetical protein